MNGKGFGVPALKEAFRITLMLDKVLGEDRFDRGPVQVEELACSIPQRRHPKRQSMTS